MSARPLGDPPSPARRRRLIGAAGLTILLLVLLLNSAGILALDIKPEVYLAPWRMVGLFSQPWQGSPQLGWPSFNVGLAPVPAFVGLLQTTGISAELSVRLLRFLLYTVGAVGAAYFTRSVTRSARLGWAGLVAAFAFVANPYSVVSGATLAILLPMALLPWMSLTFLRGLREPQGWRWPAMTALLFWAMSGMNAGVVPLLQLLVIPFLVWFARSSEHVTWRDVLRVCLRTAVLLTLVSAYWLVPSVVAAAQGVTVLGNSETLEGINSTSSLAEVLRGLGFWPMYGSDIAGPWQAGFSSYLTNSVVLILSFAVPLLLSLAVLRARGPWRVPLTAMVVAAAVLMVGIYPWQSPSPFGQVLLWLFDHVPVTGAFRTLNKAGAVLVLGGAVLLAIAVAGLRPSRWPSSRRAGAVVGLVAVGVAAVWPALSGGLFPRTLPIPSYWNQAAESLNTGSDAHRVWFVPGEVQSDYTWASSQPDDLALPLISRPTVLRTTLPIASPVASNLLAAVDTDLQKGQLLPGDVSAVARYLAVDQVLVRNDTDWQQYFGARPWTVHGQVDGDPGLGKATGYGFPGQNIAAVGSGPVPTAERSLTPLQTYPVTNTRQLVRAESPVGMVLVDGDGFSVSPLVSAGILDKGQAFRYLSALDEKTFASLLGSQRRLVLTDSNRRRTSVLGWLAGNQGPLLPADADPGSTRALGTTQQQTVLITRGGTVTATQVGSSFGVLGEAVPENAFDGDPTTSWQFGDFGGAPGQSITLTTPTEHTLSSVSVTPAVIGPVTVSRVRLTVGGQSVDADVAATGTTTIAFPQTSASTVTLQVLATRGAGYNRVGISEIDVDGVRVTRVARMPLTLSTLAASLDDTARTQLTKTPLDIQLRRETGVAGAYGDEERTLQRQFVTPDARTYRVYGLAQVPRDLGEQEADTLAGADPAVTATSSSRLFDDSVLRASRTLDGDPATAWSPGGTGVGPGESVTVTGPRQRITHVDVTQPQGPGTSAGLATKVRVTIDGVVAAEQAVGAGTVRIDVAPVRATSVTVTILDRNTGLAPVRISELGIGSWSYRPNKARAATACVSLGDLDGAALRVRLLGNAVPGTAVLVASCDDQHVSLLAGTHVLSGGSRWVADRLVLRDVRGEKVIEPGPVPTVLWTSGFGPTYDVRVGPSSSPYLLVLGNSFDDRWTVSGAPQGTATRSVAVDGYANAWTMSATDGTRLTLQFATQNPSLAAMAISGATLLAAVVMAFSGPVTIPLSGTGTVTAGTSTHARVRRRYRGSGRDAARWVVAGVTAWFLLGWWGIGTVAVLAALTALVHPRRRSWIAAVVLVAAAIPVSWLVAQPAILLAPSTLQVAGNLWPHRFATVLLVLTVGLVLLEDGHLRPLRRHPRATSGPGGDQDGSRDD